MEPGSAPQQPLLPVTGPATQGIVAPSFSILRTARVLSGLFLTLMFLGGFSLQVVGVSKILKDCKSVEEDFQSWRHPPIVRAWYMALDINCEDITRPFWCATCFQCIVVVGIGVATTLSILRDMRLVILTLLAVTTLQVMDRAEEALDTRNRSLFDREGGRIAAAGYIISAIANLVLLFIVGIKRMPHPQLPNFNMNGSHGQP